MGKQPTTQPKGRGARESERRFFRARFPDGTSMQRGHSTRVFTHAYLVLYERPDGKDGYQRGFCSSRDEAEAKVDRELRWLSKNRHTLIEAFIVDAQDITSETSDEK